MFNEFMNVAINEAVKALNNGEVPVGAVIVRNNEVIAKAHNMREALKVATAHAEIIAIEEACKAVENWRLSDCDMYVTLEPCPMCSGAILQARIKNLYFGSFSRDNGCMGTVVNLPKMLENSGITVYGGIMEEECNKLINNFFK